MSRRPGTPRPSRAEPSPVWCDGLDFTLAETKHLWWFLVEGEIMSLHVRRLLRASWGFCPRHTWAFATADCDLGWRPSSVCTLYEDLTARAARAVLARPHGLARRRLDGNGQCVTCRYTSHASGDPAYARYRDQLNRRERTTEKIVARREAWQQRSCPSCLGGGGPVCRPHLLAGAGRLDPALAEALAALAERVDRLRHSFRWQAPPVSEADATSWIEALGWFAGWEFPARIVAAVVR